MSGAGTTIVTQTCPAPGQVEAFGAWQQETSRIVAAFPGFVRQTVVPPSPPTQVDWVILQHFADRQSAVDWLRSDVRRSRLAEVQGLLVGHDDVHLVEGDGVEPALTPVSAVIATRVKPGQEAAYRAWEQRIAAAQVRAPGFQGYRLEPPIPGVQEDWLAIIRFDTEANLQAWLASPARAALVEESAPFTDSFHIRVARTGFGQWFDATGKASGGTAPAWKQNMVVLLLLYPVVFLFGYFVQTPLLSVRAGLPFAVALFCGNVASVILLNYLVPWTSQQFHWWLAPAGGSRSTLVGTAGVLALYVLMVGLFTWLS